MWAPVVFDYATWALRYPEFVDVSPALAALYFRDAGAFCDNGPCSPIPSGATSFTRDTILNMITAHLARLATLQLVGRVDSASQGSVSVHTDYGAPGSAAWWAQTQYGAMAWQLLAPFRTALYIGPPLPAYGGFYTGIPAGFAAPFGAWGRGAW